MLWCKQVTSNGGRHLGLQGCKSSSIQLFNKHSMPLLKDFITSNWIIWLFCLSMSKFITFTLNLSRQFPTVELQTLPLRDYTSYVDGWIIQRCFQLSFVKWKLCFSSRSVLPVSTFTNLYNSNARTLYEVLEDINSKIAELTWYHCLKWFKI